LVAAKASPPSSSGHETQGSDVTETNVGGRAILNHKAAIVTGGAQGIGLAIATALASEGASVVIGDLDGGGASLAARGLGGPAVGVTCDVTSEPAIEGLVERCRAEFGSVDVMVNNAGITRDKTMRKMSLEDFRAVLDVHLQGAWLGTRLAADVMREQGRGSIVNISSLSGKQGNPGQTNYSAAKAGIVGLTKAAAKELSHLGVRVNAVQPGLIRTAMTEAMSPAAWDSKVAEIPMGRAGEPEEVANVVLFLASDLASYMTGTVIEVAGGRGM
jgi:3-oxoacyl-[acyl-carrier protein] reductase